MGISHSSHNSETNDKRQFLFENHRSSKKKKMPIY